MTWNIYAEIIAAIMISWLALLIYNLIKHSWRKITGKQNE
jgi:hypothetical protein